MHRRQRIILFVDSIWSWYASHKRVLPWRDLQIKDDSECAYRVLVSEIMLQQTQVPRVVIIYGRFLDQFPTLADLAKASNKDVILAWRGMGYNGRALRLRDAARSIIEVHRGAFPRDMDLLMSIKGIGHYTAGAIRNFAFDLPTPCIDTNIRRILHRTFVGPESPNGTWVKNDAWLLALASEILTHALASPEFSPSHWHAALMDFGSLVQTKRNPRWDLCPLTARGIMKTTPAMFEKATSAKTLIAPADTEPGRTVGGRFIPNRIFRGRVVEELRDANAGLSFDVLGSRIAADWSPTKHRLWLRGIVEKLERDRIVTEKDGRFVLGD